MFRRDMREPVKVAVLYLVSLPVLIGSAERLFSVWAHSTPTDWVNQRYLDNPGSSVLHILPGVVFFLIGPLQFSVRFRRTYPDFHRKVGKLFIASGTVSGAGVIWMVLSFPAVGGLMTQLVTTAIVAAMIGLLAYAYVAARHKRYAVHRRAMVRAYALGMSVSTARIFIEAAELCFGLPFLDTFTIASALGVTLNILVAEAVLRRWPELVFRV